MDLSRGVWFSRIVSREGFLSVRPEKLQFLEKGQNRNFGYKSVISVKNPKFILYISDDETDCTIGIVSQNLANT